MGPWMYVHLSAGTRVLVTSGTQVPTNQHPGPVSDAASSQQIVGARVLLQVSLRAEYIVFTDAAAAGTCTADRPGRQLGRFPSSYLQ